MKRHRGCALINSAVHDRCFAVTAAVGAEMLLLLLYLVRRMHTAVGVLCIDIDVDVVSRL